MPTRKQRRRDLKSKRHEYEFVYVDGEGNEVDEPEEAEPEPKPERTNGSKPVAQKSQKATPRGGRTRREPPVPSWSRAIKRSALLGIFVMIFFSLTAKGNLVKVLPTAVLFAAAYVPLMYYIDRAAYRRFQNRGQRGTTTAKPPAKTSPKKR